MYKFVSFHLEKNIYSDIIKLELGKGKFKNEKII